MLLWPPVELWILNVAGALLLRPLRRYLTALFAATLLTCAFAAAVVYRALWVLTF